MHVRQLYFSQNHEIFSVQSLLNAFLTINFFKLFKTDKRKLENQFDGMSEADK